MTGDKVLYLASLGADYGGDMLYRGLYELLGPERLVEFPYKPSHHGLNDRYPERVVGGRVVIGPPTDCWTDEALWRLWLADEPSTKDKWLWYDSAPTPFAPNLPARPFDPDVVIDMLRKREFGLMVLASPRHFNSAAMHEILVKVPNPPPIVQVDNEDYLGVRWDFIRAFHPVAYFKRTWVTGPQNSPVDTTDVVRPWDSGPQPSVQFFPFPFSSIWDFKWVPYHEREVDILCLYGHTWDARVTVKRAVQAAFGGNPDLNVVFVIGHPLTPDGWRKMLTKSRIVVDSQPVGTDTGRLWEGLSAGCVVLADLKIKLPASLTPGEHFVHYNHPDELPGLISGLLADPDHQARVGRAGYDQVRACHTAKERARYLIQCAKECGVAFEP